MALLVLPALLAIGFGGAAGPSTAQQPRTGGRNPSSEFEMEVRERPQIRTLNYIMQTNPDGFADLVRAVGSRRADPDFLSGTFSPSEIGRLAAAGSANRRAVRVTAKGLGATPQLRASGTLWNVLPFDPDKLVQKDPLDFGMVLKDNPAPTMEVGSTAYGEGSASWSLSGSKAFSVVQVKTTDWVSNSSGSGYEKTVEHGGSKFPVTAGTMYRVFVRFDPKAANGPQTGQLQINEPNRTVVVPLKGDSFGKGLSVKVASFTPNAATIMPNESVDVTVNVDVLENSGSQLVFRSTGPQKGIQVVSESQWVAKSGPATQKLRIRTSGAVPDALIPVTIGIYPVNSGSPLTTFTVPLTIRRQWAEWNYDLSSGNQKVWGKLQVANTGEYIWNLECYNSSLIYPDFFCSAFAVKGLGASKNPGSYFVFNLPQGDTDRAYVRQTGKLPSNDFAALRTAKVAVYLGIDEGGPVGAAGSLFQSMVDLMQKGYSGDPYEQIPDNFSGAWKKWMIKQNFTKTKVTDMKVWK